MHERQICSRFVRWIQSKSWLIVFLATNIITIVLTIVFFRTDDPFYHLVVQEYQKSNNYDRPIGSEYIFGKYLNTSIRHCDCMHQRPQQNVSVFFITPTYNRDTQVKDLTILCQTLWLAGDVVWIVIEDSPNLTTDVKRVVHNCPVNIVHISVPTPSELKSNWWQVLPKHRGITQRNAGLEWLRDTYKHVDDDEDIQAVVYFGDDDNLYDVRLFDEIRKTIKVSVFPVGFVSNHKYEGPICSNGRVVSWKTDYAPKREFPIDMAGFAIHLRLILNHPQALQSSTAQLGAIETEFLKQFSTHKEVECRGSAEEVLVWHMKSYRYSTKKMV